MRTLNRMWPTRHLTGYGTFMSELRATWVEVERDRDAAELRQRLNDVTHALLVERFASAFAPRPTLAHSVYLGPTVEQIKLEREKEELEALVVCAEVLDI